MTMTFTGKFEEIQQKILVDTGASTSILCSAAAPQLRQQQYSCVKSLQSYNGKTSMVPFVNNIKCKLGDEKVTMQVGLQDMDGVGIMGSDMIKGLGLTIDLVNKKIYKAPDNQSVGDIISAVHRLGAIKASEELKLPNWETDVMDIVTQHRSVFARHKLSCGKTTETIEVPGPDPRSMRQYRFPQEAQDGIDETIKALLSQGVLKKTSSPCNSPIWPVKKADGKTWRLTVDYRGVNKVTPRIAPVVAKYPKIIAQIANGARWFSVIDISNAFFSIGLHPNSWHKFAFTYKAQQYTFTRLPQGFHNAPTICHRAVSKLWKGLMHSKNIISYVDDILIATPDRETHLAALDEVLDALKKAGFIINPEKAQLLKKEVTYLGVRLGHEGRTPDKERVELISKLPAPTDVHSL